MPPTRNDLVPPTASIATPDPAAALLAPASFGTRARGVAFRYAMVGVLVALTILATVLYPAFLSPGNLNNLFAQIAPVAIVAIGMTYVIIAGGFDLSVTAIFAGASVSFASLSNAMPLWLAFVVTLLLAAVAGIANGLIITVMRVNTFIATLASSSLISGVTYLYSNAKPIVSTAPGFQTLGIGTFAGVWVSIFMLVIVTVIGAVVLSRTTFGRAIYAVGGNAEAARLVGMRVNGLRVSTFVITALCAAIAGMIVASQTGIGQANIGANITLDSIAIVIIGGTSLLGGEGAIWRTGIGILIWATITNLFATLALNTSAQLLMKGGIVLVAVAIDTLSRRNR